MLEKMTEKDLLEWYKSDLLEKVKKVNLPSAESTALKGRLRHDIWSAYDYGGVVKFVYIKTAPKARKEKPLFTDYEASLLETLNAEKSKKKTNSQNGENERFANSVSRSKARVYELAMCNEFTHFCTFTQDKTKRDRFDLGAFRKDLAQLVRNINRDRAENSKIKYLLIPEQHKDGAWHFHGFFMGLQSTDLREFTLAEKIPHKIRKMLENGEKVYNWERYSRKFGYFTCTAIKDKNAVSKYITKYVTKDMQSAARENGGHLFFASQGLKSRVPIVKNCADKCPIEKWDFENEYVKVFELNVSNSVHKI